MVDFWTSAADVVGDLVDRIGTLDGGHRFVTIEDMRRETMFATTQLLVRRDEYFAAGGCAPWCHRADDWILNGCIAMQEPIPVLEAPLVFYRVQTSSQSHDLSESYLPLMMANLALRLGSADPTLTPSDGLLPHLIRNYARDGGGIRRAVGFALVDGGLTPNRSLGWRGWVSDIGGANARGRDARYT